LGGGGGWRPARRGPQGAVVWLRVAAGGSAATDGGWRGHLGWRRREAGRGRDGEWAARGGVAKRIRPQRVVAQPDSAAARFLCFYPFVKSLPSVNESTWQNLCCVPDKRHTANVLFVGICTP